MKHSGSPRGYASRRVRFGLCAALALAFGAVLALAPRTAQAQEPYEDSDPSALTDFRGELDPYGTWVDDPTYGTVWMPHTVVVGADFVPYRTAGRWGVADDGSWLWVSDYSWGWVPFHYGRWVWMPARGWGWVPGRVYAPAWVGWRTGEPGYDYVGWAPMAPTYFWFGGGAVAFYGSVVLPFWYVDSYWLFDPYWHLHIVDHEHVHVIHEHSNYVHHHGGGSGHVPANPSGHNPADPNGSGHGSAASHNDGPHAPKELMAGRPSSPTFDEAHIVAARQPKATSQDAKALAYAKPATLGGKGSAPTARSAPIARTPVTRTPPAAHALPSTGERTAPIARPTRPTRPRAPVHATTPRAPSAAPAAPAAPARPRVVPSRPAPAAPASPRNAPRPRAVPRAESHASPSHVSRPSAPSRPVSRPAVTHSRPAAPAPAPAPAPAKPHPKKR